MMFKATILAAVLIMASTADAVIIRGNANANANANGNANGKKTRGLKKTKSAKADKKPSDGLPPPSF